MALIDPATGLTLIFIFGITNIIGLILVMLSCRCLFGMRNSLGKSSRYLKFYKRHCYYWWFFIASVIMHTVLAFIVFYLK